MSKTTTHSGKSILAAACVVFLSMSSVFGQGPSSATVSDPISSWTNSEGKNIRAKFVNLDSDKLVIRTDAGYFGIAMDSLSLESQKQAVKLAKQNSGKFRKVPSLLLDLERTGTVIAAYYDQLIGLKESVDGASARVRDSKLPEAQSRALMQKDMQKVQAQRQEIKQRFEKVNLDARQLRIQIAASLLQTELSGLEPELIGRIKGIAKRMMELESINGTPDPNLVRNAESLHTVARLLLSSAHLRSLGETDAADRIQAEADSLEKRSLSSGR
ncbi:hypothetical protein LOC67_22870 [Stieleria sp. JC731]|uniref:hypothetical protein n=1 Tax=Pirellulaceae TaxID=2691357 RepID=UPI001E547BED|nr:hypothetical protein [Stieleria sp. JC731]MCC9603403.1 hypothetical protein [Stieleria sp. JC731]